MRPSVPDVHITEALDADLAAYRALAWQAPAGLIFGLLSPLAMIGPMLWGIPLLGVVFCHWALRRIGKYSPGLAGKKMAWAGMTLSLLFAFSAPTECLAYRWLVRNEARQFADLWFGFLTQDEPQKAHQLFLLPQQRQPPNVRLWDFYRQSAKSREELEKFTAMPAVRALLTFGPRSQTRFYDFEDQIHENGNDCVELTYAVTYEESGERKSFFVLVRALRTKLAEGGACWRILNVEGGVRPKDFESDR